MRKRPHDGHPHCPHRIDWKQGKPASSPALVEVCSVDLTTIEELSCKDVINLRDGSRLGNVCDVQIDICSGCVKALIIFGRPRFFGLFGRDEDLLIPWENIDKIGEDTILVDCEPCCGPVRPRGKKGIFGFLH